MILGLMRNEINPATNFLTNTDEIKFSFLKNMIKKGYNADYNRLLEKNKILEEENEKLNDMLDEQERSWL